LLDQLRALFSDLDLPIKVQTDELFWKGITDHTKPTEGDKLLLTLGLGEVLIFQDQNKILLEAVPFNEALKKTWLIIEWEEKRTDLLSATVIKTEQEAQKWKNLLRDSQNQKDHTDSRKRKNRKDEL